MEHISRSDSTKEGLYPQIDPLTVTFQEKDGYSRTNEPISFSIAFAPGALATPEQWVLLDNVNGNIVPSVVTEASYWPDGTLSWVLVETTVSIDAWNELQCLLFANGSTDRSSKVFQATSRLSESQGLRDAGLGIEVSGPICFLPGEIGSVIRLMKRSKAGTRPYSEIAHILVYLIDKNGNRHIASTLAVENSAQSNQLRQSIEYELMLPTFKCTGKLRLFLHLDVFFDSGLAEIELLAHNLSAASHPKGLWDLGDPASIQFLELGIELMRTGISNRVDENSSDSRLVIVGRDSDTCYEAGVGVTLQQFSSGGDNSDSVVHVNADERLPALPEGFEVYRSNERLARGSRANPSGIISVDGILFMLHPQRFWQEFPSAIKVTNDSITARIFAGGPSGVHELQPGERKRRQLSLGFTDVASVGNISRHDQGAWLTRRLLPPSVSGKALQSDEHFMRAISLKQSLDIELQGLLLSPSAFAAKRELIDEYGWRHFGDVFADHESLYKAPSAPLLISHYNNQYDAVLGFGLQYLRSGDSQWLDLMNDLARHVTDIDMYHTDDDRVEFNDGLFWHTNHYEAARTATHQDVFKV